VPATVPVPPWARGVLRYRDAHWWVVTTCP
jgi:hypothetical protein